MRSKASSSADGPLVSVILPTYNRYDFLGQSIGSVLGQSYRNIELIVVDDGSTDATEDLVRSLRVPVRYVCQENRGVAAARNRGLAEAQGELIAFQDSDDLWHPAKLDLEVRLLHSRPAVGVVYTSHRIIDLENNVIGGRWKQLHSGRITEALFRSMFIIMPSTVVRRSVVDRVGQFNTALRINSDYEYWLRASLVTEFAAIEESLVDERQSPNRLTGAKAEAADLQYRMLLRFYREHGGHHVIRPAVAAQALAAAAWRAGRALRKEGLLDAADDMFTTSLKHHYSLRAMWARLRLRWSRFSLHPTAGTSVEPPAAQPSAPARRKAA
jgi:glycosyltransferase involved in cell wall biosynthesis